VPGFVPRARTCVKSANARAPMEESARFEMREGESGRRNENAKVDARLSPLSKIAICT